VVTLLAPLLAASAVSSSASALQTISKTTSMSPGHTAAWQTRTPAATSLGILSLVAGRQFFTLSGPRHNYMRVIHSG
jgi:hypothetical protein